MADPGLPTSITAGVTSGHVANSITAHTLLNKLDTTIAATSLHALIGDGTRFQSRALLSTDNPGVVVNAQTGTAYTLTATDPGKVVERNNASANTLTVPANVLAADRIVGGCQTGAGLTTIVAGAGMTLRARGGALVSAGQWAEWTIRTRSATEAVVSGDLVA